MCTLRLALGCLNCETAFYCAPASWSALCLRFFGWVSPTSSSWTSLLFAFSLRREASLLTRRFSFASKSFTFTCRSLIFASSIIQHPLGRIVLLHQGIFLDAAPHFTVFLETFSHLGNRFPLSDFQQNSVSESSSDWFTTSRKLRTYLNLLSSNALYPIANVQ